MLGFPGWLGLQYTRRAPQAAKHDFRFNCVLVHEFHRSSAASPGICHAFRVQSACWIVAAHQCGFGHRDFCKGYESPLADLRFLWLEYIQSTTRCMDFKILLLGSLSVNVCACVLDSQQRVFRDSFFPKCCVHFCSKVVSDGMHFASRLEVGSEKRMRYQPNLRRASLIVEKSCSVLTLWMCTQLQMRCIVHFLSHHCCLVSWACQPRKNSS